VIGTKSDFHEWIRIPKSEIRNNFENPKYKIQNNRSLLFKVPFCKFLLRISDLFRISIFGFLR